MGLLKATAAATHASRHPNAYGALLFGYYNVYYFFSPRKAAAKVLCYSLHVLFPLQKA